MEFVKIRLLPPKKNRDNGIYFAIMHGQTHTHKNTHKKNEISVEKKVLEILDKNKVKWVEAEK